MKKILAIGLLMLVSPSAHEKAVAKTEVRVKTAVKGKPAQVVKFYNGPLARQEFQESFQNMVSEGYKIGSISISHGLEGNFSQYSGGIRSDMVIAVLYEKK